MKNIKFLLTLAVSSSLSSLGQAAVIFNGNLDSYATGALVADSTWTFVTNNAARELYSTVVADITGIFGPSSTNKYLSLRDETNTTPAGYAYATGGAFASETAIGTISFDFYSPTVPGAQGDGFILRLGSSSSATTNVTTAFAVEFKYGGIYIATGSSVTPGTTLLASYSLDATHSISLVFNNSSSSLSYGGYTLGALSADLWLDGVRYTITNTGNVVPDTALSNFNFTEKATGNTVTDFVGTLYLDNIIVQNVAVPEPSTVGLLLGAVVAACIFRCEKIRRK